MSSLDIIIRFVRPEDAAQLRDNVFSANTLEQVEAIIAGDLQRFEAGVAVHLVAEVEGLVVGSATLTRHTHGLMAHRGEIGGLVVHPRYQRRGIARQLVEGLRDHAARLGIEILELSCRGGEPAELVYPRLGFREYGRLPRGLREPWGEQKVYDQVFFYQPVEQEKSAS